MSYNTGPWCQCFNTFLSAIYGFTKQATVIVAGKPFQPSLMFAGKAGAYTNKAPFTCSTLGQTLRLTHKHQSRLKILTRDKHSSLLRISVNYRQFFIILDLGANVVKLFFVCNLLIFVISQSVGPRSVLPALPNVYW